MPGLFCHDAQLWLLRRITREVSDYPWPAHTPRGWVNQMGFRCWYLLNTPRCYLCEAEWQLCWNHLCDSGNPPGLCQQQSLGKWENSSVHGECCRQAMQWCGVCRRKPYVQCPLESQWMRFKAIAFCPAWLLAPAQINDVGSQRRSTYSQRMTEINSSVFPELENKMPHDRWPALKKMSVLVKKGINPL